MAEVDCTRHTFLVTVQLDPATRTKRRIDIIAAQLVVLAQYTDGECAFRGTRADQLDGTGMVFRFTTASKAKAFIEKRLPLYLERFIFQALTVSKPF